MNLIVRLHTLFLKSMDCPHGTVRSCNEQRGSLLSSRDGIDWGDCSTDLGVSILNGEGACTHLPLLSFASCFITAAGVHLLVHEPCSLERVRPSLTL